jgi:hypothetical protein
MGGIELKREHAEENLHAKFLFINRKCTKQEIMEIRKVAVFSKEKR